MLLLTSTLAMSAPIVVPGEDVSRGERRVRFDTGVRDALVRRARELPRDHEPYLAKTEARYLCRGRPTDNQTILRLLGEAEEQRLVMRAEAWFERLVQAEAAWWCLGEPADATLGSRMHYVLGIAHHARGDVASASAAFEAALRSEPGLAWDDSYAPGARATFEAIRARPRPEAVRVTMVPADAAVALRLDGRSAVIVNGGFDVVPGLHLLQVDGVTRAVDIQQDDWLVVPRFVDAAVVERIDSPDGRHEVAGLVQSVPGPVLVPASRSTWRYEDHRWTELRAPAHRRAARPLVVGGLSVVAGGIAWGVAELAAANRRVGEVDENLGTPGYEDLQNRQAAGQTRFRVAVATAGLGAAATGLGVTWMVSR